MRRLSLLAITVLFALFIAGCGTASVLEASSEHDVLLDAQNAFSGEETTPLSIDAAGMFLATPALESGSVDVALEDAEEQVVFEATFDEETKMPVQIGVEQGDYTLKVTASSAKGQIRFLGTPNPDSTETPHEE